MLPFLGLLALATAWFLLPLVPALRELARPTDIAPLKVVDRRPPTTSASGSPSAWAPRTR